MPTLPRNFTQHYWDFNQNYAQETTKKSPIDEFLAYQRQHPDQKVELINGQIIPMAGGTAKHGALSLRFASKIDNFLEQREPNCRDLYLKAMGSDFGFKTKPNQIRYPDFLVVCGGHSGDVFTETPVVVGEVLSEDSTAKKDKTTKLAEYKAVVSVQEIVLVSQDEQKVVVHRRGKSIFGWSSVTYTQGVIELESIEFTLPIEELYRRVHF